MSIDVAKLWDFDKPKESEERFLSALQGASADEAIVLQSQVARTYGLRGDFTHAQQILAEVAPKIEGAGYEPQVRYYLELGRTYASATHPPESQTAATGELARAAYMHALELAKNGRLDDLAIDALHMMTFVDTEPEAQVEWNRKALGLMQSSAQPAATKWEGSLHNNMGYALHLLGRYEEALGEFRLALAARERDGKPGSIRIAHWMVAWTLRSLGRVNEALAMQLRLEGECDEVGEPDPYVFEELELLYKALGNDEKAEFYAARRRDSAPPQ
jgi:tetratricopeptide (TPR) repeat protein